MRTKTVHVCNLDVLFVLLRKAMRRSTHSVFIFLCLLLAASQCLGPARPCPSRPCICTHNHKTHKDTWWRDPKDEGRVRGKLKAVRKRTRLTHVNSTVTGSWDGSAVFVSAMMVRDTFGLVNVAFGPI